MKLISTVKVFIFILVGVLLIIFFKQNIRPVGIDLPFVRPQRLGLIYLLLISFLLGALTSFFTTIVINAKVRKKRRSRESEDLVDEE